MSNESLFLLLALTDILFVFVAARRGAEWLFGTVAINLILVGIFGAKLISLFGLTTNAGNVFYACVFFATHLLLERRGREVGAKAVWCGAVFVLCFAVLSQIATQFHGLPVSDQANGAIVSLFSFSLRIIFASILAYVFAQQVNISMYEWLKIRMRGRWLGVRSNIANAVGQLVDSLLFFSIAFSIYQAPCWCRRLLLAGSLRCSLYFLEPPFFTWTPILRVENHEYSFLA